jgi:hypothetical protein
MGFQNDREYFAGHRSALLVFTTTIIQPATWHKSKRTGTILIHCCNGGIDSSAEFLPQ